MGVLSSVMVSEKMMERSRLCLAQYIREHNERMYTYLVLCSSINAFQDYCTFDIVTVNVEWRLAVVDDTWTTVHASMHYVSIVRALALERCPLRSAALLIHTCVHVDVTFQMHKHTHAQCMQCSAAQCVTSYSLMKMPSQSQSQSQ